MANLLDLMLAIVLGFVWAWLARDAWAWWRQKRRRTDDNMMAQNLASTARGWYNK